MTRLALKFILPMTVACLALSLTARALGTTQPPNPALRGFTEGCEDKPQPCWYGIVPGIMTMEEAAQILEEKGYREHISSITEPYSGYYSEDPLYTPHCVETFNLRGDDNTIDALTIRCFRAKLGDVIGYWGVPDFVIPDKYNLHNDLIYNYYSISTALVQLQPNVEIDGFELVTPAKTFNETQVGVYLWHGFISEWRYCQLDRDDWLCTS